MQRKPEHGIYVETHRPCAYTIAYLSLNLLQKKVLSKGLRVREGREGKKEKEEPAPDLCLAEDKGLVFPDHLFFCCCCLKSQILIFKYQNFQYFC